MRVQQVPNSPYFIHYDDNGFREVHYANGHDKQRRRAAC